MSDSNLIDRRRFLEFMGRAGALAGLSTLGFSLSSCTTPVGLGHNVEGLPFTPLLPLMDDDLILAPGFSSRVLIAWNDPIAPSDRFGFNNDFIGVIPFSESEAYLWVNHETADPQFVSGHLYWDKTSKKTRAQADIEMRAVGGSLLHVKRDLSSGEWSIQRHSAHNTRFDAHTTIPFANAARVRNSSFAVGTLANCSGGVTPWGTFLTCEENYHHYYGEAVFDDDGKRTLLPARPALGWSQFFPRPPEHYGWVVEINPKTRRAVKHTALGRFAHEGATCVPMADGTAVVYMGDDTDNQCFYKFVATKPGTLTEGTLYVADLAGGRWIPLDLEQTPILKTKFRSMNDMRIRTREAAKLVGGTALDRPEDCEVDPATGAIIVALTNNHDAGRPFGQLLKIEETGGDHRALTFKSSTFKAGGSESGFACPDNLCFDKAGNLWMTTDISDEKMNQGEYAGFGNNALFFIPMKGRNAGQAFRVASAPKDAELTGPCFSPDGHTLFLSVQHPGANSQIGKNLTSHWPTGGTAIPKPAVVAISGPALDALLKA